MKCKKRIGPLKTQDVTTVRNDSSNNVECEFGSGNSFHFFCQNMVYRRVLYTRHMTEGLKSKLHIVSYDKRRAAKGNVYFVTFASESDMRLADRISRNIRNITLKPFRQLTRQSGCEDQVTISYRKPHKSARL